MSKDLINVTAIADRPLLFVGGDLSGIQKFLYNITSRKAAVSLKGRSRYLVEVIDDVKNRLLHQPNICQSKVVKDHNHEVYASGGKFYLIMDDTDAIRNEIDAFRIVVERELWVKHKGQLAIHIAYLPFSFNQDSSVNIGEERKLPLGALWSHVNRLFSVSKNKKFSTILQSDFTDFFNITDVAPNSRICAITGIESSECVKLDKDENGEELYVLPSVKEQIEIGLRLRNQEHFKTFEAYAGTTKLGILRMDVDGLGKVFIKGFSSMRDYQEFSNKLSEFFEEKLLQIQKSADFKEYLNIIYAGGDDLFAVGRWDKIIDFANEVRKAFCKHIQRNDVTISGGIAVVDAKFPIAKAAAMAGDAEDAAKEYDNGAKNAFNMFGFTLSWKDEFDFVERYKNQFVDFCQYKNMPRSILHKVMVFADMKRRNDLSYIWNTSYFLTRFKKDKGNDVAINNFCNQLEIDLFDTRSKGRSYDLIALAARWAELTLRIENN